MHAWLVFIVFGCLFTQSFARPPQMEYSNEIDLDDAEEDDNEPDADGSLADDDERRINDQEMSAQDENVPRSPHLPDSRFAQRDIADDRSSFPEYRPNTNRDTRNQKDYGLISSDDQFQSPIKILQSDKYIDANDAPDQHEATQHLNNRDVSRANKIQNPPDESMKKRTIGLGRTLNEEGDMLFENNREQVSKADKNEYNEDLGASEQERYFKQYYNTMQADNRGIADDKKHDSVRYSQRERRDVEKNDQGNALNMSMSLNNKDSSDKANNEDEESAIKRHIKKLSGEELQQLLNSLSEEKKELLKKIINDVDMTDSGYVNKREITKKAGAFEDNNLFENSQSDLNKIQGASLQSTEATDPPVSRNSETTESNKQTESQTENSDSSIIKSAETNNGFENKAELANHDEDATQNKMSVNAFDSNIDIKKAAVIASNEQVTLKTETKRETNLDDLENLDASFDDSKFLSNDYSNDKGYFCSQEENLSSFLEDGTTFDNENSQPNKREAYLDKQAELYDSMKSLEDSFPNSNAYDESAPYTGPLIRVKRKNSDQIIKKRSAGLLPDAKVAYFPYKAENEDEDNDEGNEFDDEGFYDRTSNFANSKAVDEETSAESRNSNEPKRSGTDETKSSNDNPERDTMSLGSDTDSVLSGVEGVDDNLMYNSGARNKRTADDELRDETASNSKHSAQSKDSLLKTASDNYVNLQHYQENDAFGPLPRNYEGELGRFKRIRRVKQSRDLEDQDNASFSV